MSTMPTQLDWARLAAYIDGEGCILIIKVKGIHFRQKTPSFKLQVHVYNTDPRLVVWCKYTFGCGWCGARNRKPRRHTKMSYKWTVENTKAENIVLGCLPYFIIKREQAEVALAFRQTMIRGKHPKHCTPPETVALREQLKQQLSSLKHIEVPFVLPN